MPLTTVPSPESTRIGAATDLSAHSASARSQDVELSEVPTLSAVEEVELAEAIEAGLLAQAKLDEDQINDPSLRAELQLLARAGAAAKERFILANLALVRFWAVRRYRAGGHGGLALDDLVSEGTLGLIRAVEKFDHTLGLKFSTYATFWIRNTMGRAAERNTTLSIPDDVQQRIHQIRGAADALQEDLQRPPTAAEIADVVGTTSKAVLELLAIGRRPLSLDIGLREEVPPFTDRLPAEAPGPEDLAGAADLTSQIGTLLSTLTPREQRVLTLRFGLFGSEPHSVAQTARVLDVDADRVREVLTGAVDKLRTQGRAEDLRVFLEAA